MIHLSGIKFDLGITVRDAMSGEKDMASLAVGCGELFHPLHNVV